MARMARKWLYLTFAFILAAGVGLSLDLAFRGAVWWFFWSQTGEEQPLGQVRGMVELLGNLIRPQLNTAPLAPIQHAHDYPFGINTFLQKEVEEDKLRAMLAMIRDAGFVWLRQEFPWEDLEVDGRGQFTDTRNDYDGDGVKDTIDAWLKYDRIVDLVEAHGLRLLVRLSNPPAWSRANPDIGDLAPPDDLQDFVNYATAVATRYKGRITHYQVWNEPNIYPEWGNQFVSPAGYAEMLCRTYDALKAVDPHIVVVSAAIAPTISLDGYFGYQDLVYLQNLYDLGAGRCFDVLSAQGYGLFSGPTDRRLRATTVNFARHTFYRDIMVSNGDAHKPIWISEFAWNAVEDAALPPEHIADYDRFGIATRDEAARWLPIAFQRTQEEWSWVGGVFYWFFTRADPSEQGQSFYYFRMVEPDYQPDKPTFTPLPVYESAKAYLTTLTPTLYRGTHQAEHWAIDRQDGQPVPIDGAQFDTALRLTRASWLAHGSTVSARIKTAGGRITLTVGDAPPQPLDVPSGAWVSVPLVAGRTAAAHAITLTSDAPFWLDSVRVEDNTWANVGLPTFVLAAWGVFAVGVLAWGWHTRRPRAL